MAHDIFISYSSKDKAIADAVCHFLENGGIKCWMAPRDITAGFDYGDIIVNAIKNARLFVIIFSSNSADSQWVRSELNIAFSEQIPIIPFKIDESTISGSNKLILNKTHWIDAYPKYEAKLETLVDSARKILKFKCQTISEPVAEIVDKDKNKRNLKPWLYALIILAVSLSACILFFRNKTEEYSVNNITFNTRLLSERQIDAVKSILEGMREVEGGTFLMGNPQRIDEEGMRIENDKYADQRHTVTLDSFLISSTELTQKQLAAFFDTDAMIKQPGLNRPVDYLSWNQCRAIADTLAALRLAKEKGVRTLGIVNVVGSSIAREADNVMYTWAGPEIAVATTKAYSTQLIAQYLLAMKFAKVRGTVSQNDFDAMIQSLERLPEQISLLLSHKENVQRFANRYLAAEHVFFIGRGIDYAISMEGSLKLKEISYIHSEAYAAGELKHGTISLIEDGRLVVAVLTQPELYKKTISNIQEVKTRGAFVMAVTTVGNTEVEKVADYVVYLPETNPIFANSLAIIPLQLFGYYVSIGRGLDVDKPRNLAKSVTVE